jgi:hypothetical protein
MYTYKDVARATMEGVDAEGDRGRVTTDDDDVDLKKLCEFSTNRHVSFEPQGSSISNHLVAGGRRQERERERERVCVCMCVRARASLAL